MRGLWFGGAVLLVALASGRGAAAQDEPQRLVVQKEMQAHLQSWLKNEDNLRGFRDRLPRGFDLTKGVLTIDPSWHVQWTFQSSGPGLGGMRGEDVKKPLDDIINSFLNRGGAKQSIDSIPEEGGRRARVLAALQQSPQASVTIEGGLIPPLQPPAQSGVIPTTQAPHMPVFPSAQQQWPSSQVSWNSAAFAPFLAATPGLRHLSTREQGDAVYNQGYQAYWSGDAIGATAAFRALTTMQPDRAEAWYYRALCESSQGDSTTAAASLARAVAVETQTQSARQVDVSLIRVQGPARMWIEATRRGQLADMPVPTYLARHR